MPAHPPSEIPASRRETTGWFKRGGKGAAAHQATALFLGIGLPRPIGACLLYSQPGRRRGSPAIHS